MLEFDFFNGTHFITFNLIACNEDNETVTVAITNLGKITHDTFALLGEEENRYLSMTYTTTKFISMILLMKIKRRKYYANFFKINW